MRWSLISVRLIVAISFLGIVTSGALLATLYSVNEMRAGYDEIATATIPELIEAARVGQTAQAIASTAPILAAAQTPSRATSIFGGITTQLAQLDGHLMALEGLMGPSSAAEKQIQQIRENREGLERNLFQLRQAVSVRLRHVAALDEMGDRALAVFEAMSAFEDVPDQDLGADAGPIAQMSVVLWRRAFMTALFELETVRNLARQSVRDVARERAQSALERMREHRASLPSTIGDPLVRLLADLTEQMEQLIEGEQGVFARVDAKAEARSRQDGLLTINVFLARNFIGAVAELSLILRVETQDRSLAFAEAARENWVQLAVLMGVSLLAVLWLSLFVRAQIVLRVRALRDALMTRIRGGVEPIPVTGADEITEIAEAAAFFADAADEREIRLKRAKEHAEELADRAEAANRAKSVFLANMSHELRTPLNAVIGFSELLQIGDTDGDRTKEYATDIRNSGVHLLTLINQLLDYSKIEAGEHSVEVEAIQVSEVFESLERLMRIQFQEANVTPRYHAPEDLFVLADRMAFRQIMINLLTNAAKFAYEGTDVDVRAASDGAQVVLSVSDKGIGIGRDQLSKVLLPFHQESSSYIRQAGGTGLGLAIVDSLVRLQEGSVDIDSEKGVGTSITVRLPSAGPASASTAALSSAL